MPSGQFLLSDFALQLGESIGTMLSSSRPRRKLQLLAVLLAAGGFVVFTALHFVRQPTASSYARGQSLHRELGCEGCHGAGGLGGTKNPLSSLGFVPSFRSGGSARYRVQNFEDFKAWVVYGEPRPTWVNASLRERYSVADGLIKMPAFGDTVSERDLVDLYMFYRVVSSYDRPAPAQAMKGR